MAAADLLVTARHSTNCHTHTQLTHNANASPYWTSPPPSRTHPGRVQAQSPHAAPALPTGAVHRTHGRRTRHGRPTHATHGAATKNAP